MGSGKSFIVGDLHGCRAMLEKMLGIIPWNPEADNLIFIGDYLDRGNDSKGVIELLIKLSSTYPKVRCIMGNHESIILEYLFGGDEKTFLVNGGISTLESYRINGTVYIPPEHVSFIQSMHTLIELDSYYIVHAGLKPDVKINEQAIKDMLWIRESFIRWYSAIHLSTRPILQKTRLGLTPALSMAINLHVLSFRMKNFTL